MTVLFLKRQLHLIHRRRGAAIPRGTAVGGTAAEWDSYHAAKLAATDADCMLAVVDQHTTMADCVAAVVDAELSVAALELARADAAMDRLDGWRNITA